MSLVQAAFAAELRATVSRDLSRQHSVESEKFFLNVYTLHQTGCTSFLSQAHGDKCLLLPLRLEREKGRLENQTLEARPQAGFPVQGGIGATTPRTPYVGPPATRRIAIRQVRQVNVAPQRNGHVAR